MELAVITIEISFISARHLVYRVRPFFCVGHHAETVFEPHMSCEIWVLTEPVEAFRVHTFMSKGLTELLEEIRGYEENGVIACGHPTPFLHRCVVHLPQKTQFIQRP